MWITFGENLTMKFGLLSNFWNREIFLVIPNYNYRICREVITIKNWIVNISKLNIF